MSDNPIPKQLQQFIARHIHTVEQLEILCLLAENQPKEWSVGEVFRNIQSTERSVSDCLHYFVGEGLAADTRGLFQFAPRTAEMGAAATDLVKMYRERRVTIVEVIYKNPLDPIQDFADAFRMRKDK